MSEWRFRETSQLDFDDHQTQYGVHYTDTALSNAEQSTTGTSSVQGQRWWQLYPDNIHPCTLKHIVEHNPRRFLLFRQDAWLQGDLGKGARGFAFRQLARVDDHDAIDNLS